MLEKPFTATDQQVATKLSSWVSPVDMLHRTVVDNSTRSMSIYSCHTSDFKEQMDWQFAWHQRDVEKLKKYATWQRKYIDFQATYAAFLLGALSEEEFEKDSEEYAPNIRDMSVDEVVYEIEHLSNLVDFDLRSVELAEFLETDQSIVDEALERLHVTDGEKILSGSETTFHIEE